MKRNTVFFASLVSTIAIFSAIFFFRKIDPFSIGLFIIGEVIGFILPIILDVLVPHLSAGSANVSKDFTRSVIVESVTQVKQGNMYTPDQAPTPLRSYPMLLGYLFTAVFVLTSTSNFLGRGFVMGLGLSFVLDLWFSMQSFDLLKRRWFSVFQTRLTDTELRWFVYIICGVFAVLTGIAVVV